MNLVKASLPLMLAVSLGFGACNDPSSPSTSSALQAANSKPTGSTNAPTATSRCKESTNESGLPCKTCADSSGSIAYDDCGNGGAGAIGGATGTGGSGATEVKCVPTTDPTTRAACKTCYAPDGSFTSDCAPPPPPGCVDAAGKNACGAGGSDGAGGSGAPGVKCVPTTDPSTGAGCKTCYAADGSVTSNRCSSGSGAGGSGVTEGKCIWTTDPTTSASCLTCYAPNGSITSNSCLSPGAGATCVAAPNIETGQICKVCSDAVSGKLFFVDCGPSTCAAPSPGTPAAK